MQLILNIELDGHHNIILLLICIVISSIIHTYAYIIDLMGNIIRYTCQYISENDFIALYNSLGITSPEMYVNKFSDKFYMTKTIFLFFILVRYFIIREPYLYLFFHIIIMLNFLYDKHILYTYMYLLILHISRFIFFLGEEKFKIKEYMENWQECILFTYRNFPVAIIYNAIVPSYVNPDKLIYKLTINNLNFAFFFNARYYVVSRLYYDMIEFDFKKGTYPRRYILKLKPEPWRYNFERYMATHNFSIDFLEFTLQLYPDVIKDTQKFVYVNSYFWLITFLFVTYFDIFFTNMLL